MKDRKILLKLMEIDSYISSKELSYLIQMSSKSVIKIIKNLGEEVKKYGAEIEVRRGLGYKLEIKDKKLFNDFMENYILKKSENGFNSQEYRVNYLLNKFFNADGYIKTSTLEEELFISRSQLFKDLKEVKDFISTYNLILENKPHYGLRLKGEEFHYRRCLANKLVSKEDHICILGFTVTETLEKVKEIIFKYFKKGMYKISDLDEKKLIYHIYIMLYRLKLGYCIKNDVNVLNNQEYRKEYSTVFEIADELQRVFNLEINDAERYFLSVHIESKSRIDEKNSISIEPEIANLIEDMLSKLKGQRGIDLRNNLDLRIVLSLHMIPLTTRIEYDMQLKNPLINEIKTKFLIAWDLAVCAIEVINKKFNVILSEDEIGYFALHFQVALYESKNDIKKNNILIVCSSGKGSSQLLRHIFKDKFDKYIQNILVCNVNEIEQQELDDIDYIFSTVPLKSKIPVIQIDHFLENDDLKKIGKVFLNEQSSNEILKYFHKKLFIEELDLTCKEEILKYMVENISKVKKIPNNFLEEILIREEFAFTDLSTNVAFPHPNKAITSETFVSVAILKKPVFWGKNKIQVIFMASIEMEEMKDLQQFYKSISRIMSNVKYINELVQVPEFTTLKRILNTVVNDEL